MTCLLIDLGNTRIKWAILAPEAGPSWRSGACAWEGECSTATLDTAFAPLPRPSAVWANPLAREEVNRAVADWCEQHWSLTPTWARSEAQRAGLKNGYQAPERLGADRWLAMLAAWTELGSSFCVADCGTAVTVDLVNARGEHQGGFLLPGRRLSGELFATSTGLNSNARAALGQPGRNTDQALAEGWLAATTGLVERVYADCRAADPSAALFLTGGDAEPVARLGGWQSRLRPDLVLRGLALRAQEGLAA